MILPITLPPKSSPGDPALPPVIARLGSSELFLLELQGELDVTGDKPGQLVGRLTIDDDAIDGKGKPTLRIGHHLLEGKIVSLPKPLAVLQRVFAPPQPPSLAPPINSRDKDGDVIPHSDNGDTTKDDNKSTPAATSYSIRTLIRKKIVFSKRPTPIVGLSAKVT